MSEASSSALTTSSPVRVALVDDEEIILHGLSGMLAAHREQVRVVGRLPVSEDLLSTAIELEAEVVLTEVSPEGTRALDLAGRLVSVGPPFRVVIFTDENSEARVIEAFRMGASGYLLKSLGGRELAELLARIRDGEVVVDPTMATRIAISAARQGGGESWPGSELGLSRRESDVLALLVDGGLSNRAMAARLGVGQETVKTHLRSIYKKLGVTDRAHAVALVLREGLFR